MEILLWLVPPVVVTGLAMVWVSWLGRSARHEVDREVAVQRLGRALEPSPRRWALPGSRARRPAPRYDAPRPPADRSSNVAVRSSGSQHTVPARPRTPQAFPVRPPDTPAQPVRPVQPRPRRRAS